MSGGIRRSINDGLMLHSDEGKSHQSDALISFSDAAWQHLSPASAAQQEANAVSEHPTINPLMPSVSVSHRICGREIRIVQISRRFHRFPPISLRSASLGWLRGYPGTARSVIGTLRVNRGTRRGPFRPQRVARMNAVRSLSSPLANP